MGVYILVFFVCILVGFFYVVLIRQFLKSSLKAKIPSPFVFGEDFLREWKKFGIVYLASDIVKFSVEVLIIGVGNAIVMRLTSIMITISTSGFFGRWRALVIKKINNDITRHHIFWHFLGDTFASLVFWVPMYIVQLAVLVYFDLTHWSSVWYSVYVTIGSILLFGRFGCFAADIVEKWILKRKKIQ